MDGTEHAATNEPMVDARAEEFLDRQGDNSAGDARLLRYRCEVGGQVVGYRLREQTGALRLEYSVDPQGRTHGVYREWDEAGLLLFESHYVDGLEHGVARQYVGGTFIGSYRLASGTGVDLWRDDDGALSEERHVVAGRRHGVERWWCGDNHTVWEEGHYWRDVEHGVFRQWNSRGRLRRGYPQYFVSGRRVTKRQYLRASRADPSLPPYLDEENRPERELPAEYGDSE